MLTHSPHHAASAALHTVLDPRHPRVVAAVAAACLAVGATAAIVIVDSPPAPLTGSVAAPSQPVITHPDGSEANKVASMRALSRHIAERSAVASPRFDDVEGNKAASQRLH